jgi:uncharacterized protein (TIGR01777 family)
MRIVISGSSGLVGSWLVPDLVAAGHQVVRLVRTEGAGQPGTSSAVWSPGRGELDAHILSGADAVINLNGRSIAEGRWSARVKEELRSSRLRSTETLTRAIAASSSPPTLLINASAVGYYGDRGDEVLDESSPPGTGFLADLTRDWEQAALAAQSDRTRVVLLRLGMVIGRGGALEKMLLPFKLGLGGRIGSGDQWWPWIAMEDVIGVVRFALDRPEVAGPLNLASPEELRCREFTDRLGDVLNRPTVLPLPAAAARLALGEMADALLLASTRARPAALQQHGYEFRVPDLAGAIRQAID